MTRAELLTELERLAGEAAAARARLAEIQARIAEVRAALDAGESPSLKLVKEGP